jgi:hypothetical protein
MIRFALALALLALLVPHARAGQSNAPVLAFWEFDGWTMSTPERPLGLRFVLLEDGSVIYTPDDPAIDALIPSQYFQTQLSPAEVWALSESLAGTLRQQVDTMSASRSGGWTAFFFHDSDHGALRKVSVAGHPCLARGRVFSATAPVMGLRAVQNSTDRAALSPAMREACNRLAGFHHAGSAPWSPASVPLPWEGGPPRD